MTGFVQYGKYRGGSVAAVTVRLLILLSVAFTFRLTLAEAVGNHSGIRKRHPHNQPFLSEDDGFERRNGRPAGKLYNFHFVFKYRINIP